MSAAKPIPINAQVVVPCIRAKGIDDYFVATGGGTTGALAVDDVLEAALADVNAELEPQAPRQKQNLGDIEVLARMDGVEALRSRAAAETRHSVIGQRTIPHTDAGNGERFELDHGDCIRFCPEHGFWLVFDGKRWKRDDAAVNRMMLATVRFHFYPKLDELEAVLRAELDKPKSAQNKEKSDGLKKSISTLRAWIKRSESATGLRAAVDQAATRYSLVACLESFDAPATHGLLNCLNGTVELTTGQIREHRASDLLTNIVPFEYSAAEPHAHFDLFLKRILPNEEVRGFIQRFMGYAATGFVLDHVLPIWFGDGANGKGTLAEIVKTVLGPYAVATPDGFFEDKKFDEHPTEIARLRGKRFALASETKKGAPLAESKIKKLTGGDTLTGRHMREDFFDFDPTAKYVVQTNFRPVLQGNDGGIRRRVLLVHFDQTIPPNERDPRLQEELLHSEGPGILRWLVDGAREYLANGLRVPESIRAATASYLDAEDLVSQFVEDRCVLSTGNRSLRVIPKELFFEYKAYAESAGEAPGTLKSFGADLRRMGVESFKSNSKRFFGGITLLETQHVASVAGEERPDDYVD